MQWRWYLSESKSGNQLVSWHQSGISRREANVAAKEMCAQLIMAAILMA
jgi:hypothetical protein